MVSAAHPSVPPQAGSGSGSSALRGGHRDPFWRSTARGTALLLAYGLLAVGTLHDGMVGVLVSGQVCFEGGQSPCGLSASGCDAAFNVDIQGNCNACGALGQICCMDAPQCSGTLACDTNSVCDDPSDPCGGEDEPCCAGVMCDTDSLLCTSGRCTPCGSRGEPACAGGCDEGLNPTTAGCQPPCGAEGAPCCTEGPSCTSLSTPLTCATLLDGSSECTACGDIGNPPCDGGCNSGLEPVSGACQVICGAEGEPCCADGVVLTCDDDSLACDQSAEGGPQCTPAPPGSPPCGRVGDRCCPFGDVCPGGICFGNSVCLACGGPGERCCVNDVCNTPGESCQGRMCTTRSRPDTPASSRPPRPSPQNPNRPPNAGRPATLPPPGAAPGRPSQQPPGRPNAPRTQFAFLTQNPGSP